MLGVCYHYQMEVMASRHKDDNSVACIVDKCYVLSYPEYCRYCNKDLRETTTATPTKMSLENISSRYLYYFAIIPIRSTCTMWPNYPVTEQVETAFKLRQRLKNLPSCAHVFHKTLNLVISRCCLAENGEGMCQNL